MSVKELEAEVARLSPVEMKAFAQWFQEFQADVWDRQIEADVAAGKFDEFANKADEQPTLAIKTFDLGSKGCRPSKAEIAQEMFDRQ